MIAPSSYIQWCGLATILGGIFYASLGVLGRLYISRDAPSEPQSVPPVLTFIEHIFPLFLLLGALAAIAGLHRVQREYYGLVGVLASLTAFVGVALILVGSVLETLAGPAFEPSLLFLISGLLIATLGLMTLGFVTMVAMVMPWWVGALVILGSPPFLLFVPTTVENFLSYEMLHPLLAGVIWSLVGYALFRAVAHGEP